MKHEEMKHEEMKHEGMKPEGHEPSEGKDHGNHHAHMLEDFKRRFIVSLVLTIPVLLLSPTIQGFFSALSSMFLVLISSPFFFPQSFISTEATRFSRE